MWQVGSLKAYDDAWIHARREFVVSDALPKNFVLDVADHVHPIDLIIIAPDDTAAGPPSEHGSQLATAFANSMTPSGISR